MILRILTKPYTLSLDKKLRDQSKALHFLFFSLFYTTKASNTKTMPIFTEPEIPRYNFTFRASALFLKFPYCVSACSLGIIPR